MEGEARRAESIKKRTRLERRVVLRDCDVQQKFCLLLVFILINQISLQSAVRAERAEYSSDAHKYSLKKGRAFSRYSVLTISIKIRKCTAKVGLVG